MTAEPFARIPLAVLDDASLSSSELLTLCSLYAFANDAGECWPSLDRIAERAHLTRRCIMLSLRSLEGKNRIERTKRFKDNSQEPTSTFYRIVPRESGSLGCEPHAQQVENTVPYVGKMIHHSREPHALLVENTIPYVGNMILLGREPNAPELDHRTDKDTPASLVFSKPTRPKRTPKGKPEALSPIQLTGYHAIETRLKEVAKAEGITWTHPRQGRALRSLVEAYADRLDDLPWIVDTFLRLRGGKEPFWRKQPPTASSLLALLDRVETEAATHRREAVLNQRPLQICPECGEHFALHDAYCRNPHCPQYTQAAEAEA